VRKVGPALLAGGIDGSLHPAFLDAAELAALSLGIYSQDWRLSRTREQIRGLLVPIPLLADDGTVIAVAEQGAAIAEDTLSLLPDFNQVVLFARPHRHGPRHWMLAYGALSGRVSAWGEYTSHEYIMRSHEPEPGSGYRDGREFFALATALWTSAQDKDEQSFLEATHSIEGDERFFCRLVGGDAILSGEQLKAMAELLGRHHFGHGLQDAPATAQD